MSLRLRLFLLFGGLVALLVVAQWWWVRVLTRDLSSEIDEVASSVGHSVVAFFQDFELKDGKMAPHERVFECLGEACGDVTILEACKDVTLLEDVDFSRHVGFVHAEDENQGAAGAGPICPPPGEPPEAKVLIRRFRRGGSSEGIGEEGTGPVDSDESFAYSFRFEDHDMEGVTPKGGERNNVPKGGPKGSRHTHAPAVSMRRPRTPAVNARTLGRVIVRGQKTRADRIVRPRIAGRSCRTIVSTSGSSGTNSS